MSYILTLDTVFYSILIAELRKLGSFTLQKNAKVVGKQYMESCYQCFTDKTAGWTCAPRGAALGLGLFNTSTNDLDDKTECVLIKSADDANRGRATHPSENRPGIENDLTNESSSPKHQNAL